MIHLPDDFDSTREQLLPIQRKMLDFLYPFAKACMENQMDHKADDLKNYKALLNEKTPHKNKLIQMSLINF